MTACANRMPVTTGKVMSLEELSNVHGRAWDDVDVRCSYHVKDLTKRTDYNCSIKIRPFTELFAVSLAA